jgi:hypothetical protein
MALVRRLQKLQPVSAAEYDAVVDQVEVNQGDIQVIAGQFADSQVTLSFADLATATAYWTAQDGASNTPTDEVEIYIQDVKQFFKWDASNAAKAVFSRDSRIVDYVKYQKYTTANKNLIDVSDTTVTYVVFDSDLNRLEIYKDGAWGAVSDQESLALKADKTELNKLSDLQNTTSIYNENGTENASTIIQHTLTDVGDYVEIKAQALGTTGESQYLLAPNTAFDKFGWQNTSEIQLRIGSFEDRALWSGLTETYTSKIIYKLVRTADGYELFLNGVSKGTVVFDIDFAVHSIASSPITPSYAKFKVDYINFVVNGISYNYKNLGLLPTSTNVSVESLSPTNEQLQNLQDEVDLKTNISDIKDNLTSTSTNTPLSANQGKVLKDLIDAGSGGGTWGGITGNLSDQTDLDSYLNNLTDLQKTFARYNGTSSTTSISADIATNGDYVEIRAKLPSEDHALGGYILGTNVAFHKFGWSSLNQLQLRISGTTSYINDVNISKGVYNTFRLTRVTGGYELKINGEVFEALIPQDVTFNVRNISSSVVTPSYSPYDVDYVTTSVGGTVTTYDNLGFKSYSQNVEILKSDFATKEEFESQKALTPTLVPKRQLIDKSINNFSGKQISSTNGSIVSGNNIVIDFQYFKYASNKYISGSVGLNLYIGTYDENYNFIERVNLTTYTSGYLVPTNTVYCRWEMASISNRVAVFGKVRTSLVTPFELRISDENSQIAQNDLQLPNTLYALLGSQFNIFKTHLMRFGNDWTNGVKFSPNWLQRKDMVRYPVSSTSDIISKVELIDSNQFTTKEVSLTVKVGSNITPTTAINLAFVGDSWTAPGLTIEKVVELLPGTVTSIGTLASHPIVAPGYFSEGKAGWTLANFFELIHADTLPRFSHFLHPNSVHKYYGDTSAIINILNDTNHPMYAKLIEIGFNATTGLLNTPSVNDCMYVTADSQYKYWNGSAWVVIAEATLDFSFNYGKYRSTWGIDAPDFTILEIGINDFANLSYGEVQNVWDSYFKNYVDEFIASVKADTPSCKIGIAIPNCKFSDVGFNINFLPEKEDNMYQVRRLFIENYQGLEGSDVYLLDPNIAIDTFSGYNKESVLPTEDSPLGTEVLVDNDPIHPFWGYYMKASGIAGWIQKLRS